MKNPLVDFSSDHQIIIKNKKNQIIVIVRCHNLSFLSFNELLAPYMYISTYYELSNIHICVLDFNEICFFSEFGWKRCLFRTISVCVLLFVAESIPSFGTLLDVVGASTVTMLTFVCPPFFYMKLCDQSLDNNRPKDWPLEWKRYVHTMYFFPHLKKKN